MSSKILSVILASYPRSGSTWLRYCIWLYCQKLYGEKFTFELAQFSPALVRGTLYQESNHDYVTLIKTHDKFDENNLLMTSADKVLILFRRPLDCFRSKYIKKRKFYDLYSKGIKAGDGVMSDLAIAQIIKRQEKFRKINVNVINKIAIDYLDLYNSYLSYFNKSNMPYLAMSYEELSHSFRTSFEAVLLFIGLDVIDELVTETCNENSIAHIESSGVFSDTHGAHINLNTGEVDMGKEFFRDVELDKKLLDKLAHVYNLMTQL